MRFKQLLLSHPIELGKLNWERSFTSKSKHWALIHFIDSQGSIWQQGFSLRELRRLRPSEGTWGELRAVRPWEATQVFFSLLLRYLPRSISVHYLVTLVITAFCIQPILHSNWIPNWVSQQVLVYPHLRIQSSTLVNLIQTLLLGLVMHLLIIGVPLLSYGLQTYLLKTKWSSNRMTLRMELVAFMFIGVGLVYSSVHEWQSLQSLERRFFTQLSECLLLSQAASCGTVDTGIDLRARKPAHHRETSKIQ